jgi:hypothetical protein
MRDQITRPFKDLVHIETDESKMGPKQIRVGVRERRQKTIARIVGEIITLHRTYTHTPANDDPSHHESDAK